MGPIPFEQALAVLAKHRGIPDGVVIAPNNILLAHNVPFTFNFLAMPLSRIGVPYPPHYLFDTLDMTRRLYPAWSSHSSENVAIRLNVASGAERWALSDARLGKEVFLSMLQRTPTLKKISELMPESQPLTFADALGCAIEAPAGFEALTSAIAERCAITIIYEREL
jgi:DNA polymerase III epsilon subunit-like protein